MPKRQWLSSGCGHRIRYRCRQRLPSESKTGRREVYALLKPDRQKWETCKRAKKGRTVNKQQHSSLRISHSRRVHSTPQMHDAYAKQRLQNQVLLRLITKTTAVSSSRSQCKNGGVGRRSIPYMVHGRVAGNRFRFWLSMKADPRQVVLTFVIAK